MNGHCYEQRVCNVAIRLAIRVTGSLSSAAALAVGGDPRQADDPLRRSGEIHCAGVRSAGVPRGSDRHSLASVALASSSPTNLAFESTASCKWVFADFVSPCLYRTIPKWY